VDSKKISLCITNYNRLEYLLGSFADVVNDDRISEIVIADDCSERAIQDQIIRAIRLTPKVKFHPGEKNLGVYANKRRAVSLAENEYCILFDSDNVITKDYIDAIYRTEWNHKTILAPDLAWPHFDYTHFAGINFSKLNVAKYANLPRFDCLANTCNYFVHRDSYLSVWQPADVDGEDSIYFFYLWLLSGNDVYCVSNMKYFHRTEHKRGEYGSNYNRVAVQTAPRATKILELISRMR